MKSIVFLVLIVLQTYTIGFAGIKESKNKVGAGSDGRFEYNRILPYGVYIGTDWKYPIVFSGRKYIHMDQDPQAWFLTASHCWSGYFASWENRLSFFDTDYLHRVRFTSTIRKPLEYDERWALVPSIVFFDYVFDPAAIDDNWPSTRLAHSGVFKTELSLELELYF